MDIIDTNPISPRTYLDLSDVSQEGVMDVALQMVDDDGNLRLLSTEAYKKLNRKAVRMVCHFSGRYGLPTVELVEFLKKRIAGRRAIEIGAGNGDLGRHLGIRMTDSKQQSRPDVKAHYALTGQPTITYPKEVEEIEALEAVKKYKPQVVIGSWVTQWIDPNKPFTEPGNVWGIKEDEILELVDEYIVIGNLAVHASKRICKLPHEELSFDFIQSRASFPEQDRIFIWTKNK